MVEYVLGGWLLALAAMMYILWRSVSARSTGSSRDIRSLPASELPVVRCECMSTRSLPDREKCEFIAMNDAIDSDGECHDERDRFVRPASHA